MFNSLRYRLFAWLLLFVLLTALLIIPTTVMHRIKYKQINQVVLSINSIYIDFLKDSKAVNDFLFVEPVNANFFVKGESPYLTSHINISNIIANEIVDLRNIRQFKHFEIQNDINLLSENLTRFNILFDSLVYLVFKRGYEDYGLEGELYTYGAMLENSPDIDRSIILQLRRIENDYLLKDDPGIAGVFNVVIAGLQNSVKSNPGIDGVRKIELLDLIESYSNSFSRIVKTDEKTGIRKNIALKAELNMLGTQTETSLQAIIDQSKSAQNTLIARLNVIYFGFLLFIICLIFFFSYVLSRHVVFHLESLANHISALTKNRLKHDVPITLRNPTREISQIYREFRSLILQLNTGEKQRVKALQTAEDSLKRYQELADMLPQSIFETNSWGNYTYANKAWYRIFGYSENDLTEGLNLIETLISESKEDDIMSVQKIENSNFIGIRKDGSRFPASLYSDSIVKNGEIVGRRGLIVDITDKINYIHSLQKETTKAKTSDELKSSFLANMSHEIRTPVNSIIGFSNLMAVEQIPDEQKKDFVNYIRSSSETLLNLVDDIIDIAKIEAGELKINKKECELKELCVELQKTFEEVKKKYNKQHLNIIFRPDQQHPHELVLKTDPFRLKQILANLISNALKFTEKGYVEFGYAVKEDRVIEFHVKDTGVGLSRNELDLIFERFKRSRQSENKNIAGTGLGLAITKNLVQLLGGEMWVDSKPNNGTVFFFTLPYLRPSSAAIQKDRKYPVEKHYNWSGKKILIAEDDSSNFSFLRELLKKTHVKIIRASSGKEAVELCRTIQNIDLVIMDIQLPEMNGLEATKHIKQLNNNLPVIAQTAFAMAGDRERIKEAGCDDYISKPIDIQQFLSIINYHIKPVAKLSDGENTSAALTNPRNHLDSDYMNN